MRPAIPALILFALGLAACAPGDTDEPARPALTSDQIPAAGAEIVRLQASRTEVRTYEPIYLRMDLIHPDGCFDCNFSNLEMSEMVLAVSKDGAQPFAYRPPVKACGPADPAVRVAHSTLMLSAGHILTAEPGVLRLSLRDPNGRVISNELVVTITPPSTAEEQALVASITPEKARDYGLFVYFGGGDHLKQGLAIVRAMADSDTPYAAWANLVMARNLASESRNWRLGTVERAPDLSQVAQYLARAGDDGPERLHLDLLDKLGAELSAGQVPGDLRDRLLRLRDRHPGRAVRGR